MLSNFGQCLRLSSGLFRSRVQRFGSKLANAVPILYSTANVSGVIGHSPELPPKPSPQRSVKQSTSSIVSSVQRRPELDFDYLLCEDNLAEIRESISNRKQVGDIDRVHALWNDLQAILCGNSTGAPEMPSQSQESLETLWNSFYDEALRIPNKSSPDSPIGDESCNRVVKHFGEKRTFDFPAREADIIGQKTYNCATNYGESCGAKAYAFYGDFATLERALIDTTLQFLLTKGFTPILVPDIISEEIPLNCGLMQRSDSRGVLYYVQQDDLPAEGSLTSRDLDDSLEPRTTAPRPYCLSGTGEMGIAAYLSGKTFELSELPKRFVTVSRCYRPEITEGRFGSGLYRVHEFVKVEMFAVVANELGTESSDCLEEFRGFQEEIFQSFGLHCRILDMATQELGASAYRKYDVEAWLYGKNRWGEISSASNCTDFQSRRLGIKYRSKNGGLRFAHTINGTACAIPRTIIAVVEQGQRKNILIDISQTLQSAVGGKPFLTPARPIFKTRELKIPGLLLYRDDRLI